MGLENLLAITDEDSQYRKSGVKLFNDSITMEHWYFFAVTGLNITQKLLSDFKNGKFDMDILDYIDILLEDLERKKFT